MMLKDAFELLQKTAVDAECIGMLKQLNDTWYLWDGQQFVLVPIDPEKREHQVDSIDSFLLACSEYGESGSVWHSEAAVVLLIDDQRRDERVTLGLSFSQQWKAFIKGFQGGPAETRKYLRRSLSGACPINIPAQFGKVDFNRRSQGHADVSHQRESLGKSVESEVSATESLPEEITLSLRVYELMGLPDTITVQMAMDIDFERQQFCFSPVAGEVEAGMRAAQAKLHELLEQSNLSVFYGIP